MALQITGKATPMYPNEASRNSSGTTYTQRFQVLFSDIGSASGVDLQLAETLALDADGVPNIQDNFRGNKAAYCNAKSAATRFAENKPVSVIVTCTFTTLGTPSKDQDENPLDKVPVVTWSNIFEREAITSAREIRVFQDGDERVADRQQGKGKGVNNFSLAINNSFGASFESFPEKEVPYMQWTVVENVAVFDVNLAVDLLQTVNHLDFKIDGYTILAGRNLLTQRSATQQFSGKFSYREQTTSGIIKLSHDVQVVDNGDMQYNPKIAAGNKFNIGALPKGDKGIKTIVNAQEAVDKLDGHGNQLKEGKKPVFINFKVYEAQDHKRLHLPEQRR